MSGITTKNKPIFMSVCEHDYCNTLDPSGHFYSKKQFEHQKMTVKKAIRLRLFDCWLVMSDRWSELLS